MGHHPQKRVGEFLVVFAHNLNSPKVLESHFSLEKGLDDGDLEPLLRLVPDKTCA